MNTTVVTPFIHGFVERPPVIPASPKINYDELSERSDFMPSEVKNPLLMSPTLINPTWTDEAH